MSRILVIDDNDLIATMLREALTEHGYDVSVAMDANQGYTLAHQARPDLIILDIQLPDVTGFDLCRLLKNRPETRDTPIIMVTGSARSTEEKVKGFQMGIDDYLLKPFEIAELLERVRAVLRRREQRPAAAEPSITVPTSPDPVSSAVPPPDVPHGAILDSVARALVWPETLSRPLHLPGISFFYLTAMLVVTLLSLALSAGDSTSVALAGVGVIVLWAGAVALLVMGGTLMGIAFSWKEGAALISLASMPILLKGICALLFVLWTTLSPWVFTAGYGRIDLFELWAVGLLYHLIARGRDSTPRHALGLTVLVWLGTLALLAALGRAGAG